MAYVNPPEPDDHVVMVETEEGQPNFTWGDHRAMKKFLDEVEEDNPAIREARERLDEYLGRVEIDRICSFCHQLESTQRHDPECPDNNDPSLWVKREAGGYQYLTDKFEIVHTTSVPMNDEEACAYFSIVQMMVPREGPDFWVRYISRREIYGTTYQMMPWQYNKDVQEVFPIVRSGA